MRVIRPSVSMQACLVDPEAKDKPSASREIA
jgi:hypothetical protein